MFDEARLRGIDLDQLQNELPTSEASIRMKNDHESKAKIYWLTVKELDRTGGIILKTVKKDHLQGRVEPRKSILFSSEQIRIAKAIFRKEKK
jgi:hypothetical protein